MKRSGHRRWAVWGVVLVALVASAVWTLRAPAIHVTTAHVTRGPLVSTVSGEGRSRVKDLYVVAAPVDGRLERVTAKVGDALRSGDTVATLRPLASTPLDPRSRAEATAALAAAKAATTRAEAAEAEARVALEHANSRLDTTRQLAERNAAAPNDLVHLGHEAAMRQSALDAAIAATVQARAEFDRARAVLGSTGGPGQPTAVPSPVAGRILRILRESAGPISAGTPILEVGDLTRLEVTVDLLSSDAAAVHPGARASVTGWGGPEVLEASVQRVDPAAFTKVSALGLEEQRVRVVLDLAAPPPTSLGHDYRVDAAIVVWEGANVLCVPSTALFRVGSRWAVFRVAERRARKALVELGPTDGMRTVVASGLNEADEVLVQPSDLIDDGTRVVPLLE